MGFRSVSASRLEMRRSAFGAALVGLVLLTFGPACREKSHDSVAGAAHEKHWGYEDGAETVGPEHWGALPGEELCATGRRQSPIALRASGEGAAASRDIPGLAFDYRPSKLSMINNGHTVQVNYDVGSSVSEGGTSYRLAQFHFHASSEHTLDGRSFPLEIHLVHVGADGKPELVVGVFVQEGAENAALAAAFRELPKHQGETVAPAAATIDAAGVLPAARTHFAYDGSLTTPPCTEGIRWRVLREPIEMSQEQIEAFRSLPHLGRSQRPLQPLGSRAVLLGTNP
ncbi:MAG: carbonic anhydrase [Thermoanaerobaculia bacterium]